MARLLILLFVLPWWAYFPLAGGAGWLTLNAYRSAMTTEAERAQALAMPIPAPVDLTGFALDSDRHLADEVHVTGWIDPDLNYELVKKTNGVTTSRRFMMALFGAEDTKGDAPVRAVLVMTEAEKAAFTEHFDDYIIGFAANGPRLAFNGFARVTDPYYSLVADAIKDEGYSRDKNFFYLKPFFQTRDVALAPKGAPLKTLLFGTLVMAALSLVGIGKKLLGARRIRRTPAKDPACYMPPPPPLSTVPQNYDVNTPLGRIAARQARQAGQGAMGPETVPGHPASEPPLDLDHLPDPLAGMTPATDRKANLAIRRRVRHLRPTPALTSTPVPAPASASAPGAASSRSPEHDSAPGALPERAKSSRAFYLKLTAAMLLVGLVAYDARLIAVLAPFAVYFALAVMVYRMGFKLRDRLRGLLRRPEVI